MMGVRMMEQNVSPKDLQKQLTKKWNNGWDICNSEKQGIMEFNQGYKRFLDEGKTERECVRQIVSLAEASGYKNLKEYINNNINVKCGDKIYAEYKDKSVAMFIIGQESILSGMNIIASHLDSPRLDLKPVPLYESDELALLKTHYYGGVKKYQWTAIPLSLHGRIIKKDGSIIDVVIGEKDEDPVLMISDLLPHLAKDQVTKPLGEAITGEGLNVIIGSIPYQSEDLSDKVKFNILTMLKESYDIEEEDFVSAEIEIVPAGKARDIGLDRGLVGAYGHDDRVCAYTSLMAILETEKPNKTAVALFVDKEEVGSMGNTGMHSRFFEDTVAEIVNLTEEGYSDLKLRRAMANSSVLSGDVNAAFDPNYPEVMDKKNSCFIGKGIVITKYTGSRGKGGCNDANAEFMGKIRRVFNQDGIVWQTGELGKVDQGGGGTVAYILANYGMDVVDCGVPVLSMHAPYEIVSKLDVYMTYKGYKSFFKID